MLKSTVYNEDLQGHHYIATQSLDMITEVQPSLD